MKHTMPLGQFMALSARIYYENEKTIGRGGDFVTAPEVSQVFGEMIALWFYFAHEMIGKPQEFNLVELGPGKGTLFADILRTSKKWPGFQSGMHCYLVEQSETLKAVQREKLGGNVSWVSRIEDIPIRPTLFVANEFFDALPIEQYRNDEGETQQAFVDYCDETFRAEKRWQKCEGSIKEAFLEKSPVREAYLKKLLNHFQSLPMTGLVIDYGDENLNGVDTFQGIYGGKKTSPLENVGETDVTSHVDFGALKKVSENLDFQTIGPVLQGDFLKELGIEVRTQQLSQKSAHANDILMATYRLISYSEMGSLFKVMNINNVGAAHCLGFGNDCV